MFSVESRQAHQDAAHVGVVADAAAGRRVAPPRLGRVQVRQVRLQQKGTRRFKGL